MGSASQRFSRCRYPQSSGFAFSDSPPVHHTRCAPSSSAPLVSRLLLPPFPRVYQVMEQPVRRGVRAGDDTGKTWTGTGHTDGEWDACVARAAAAESHVRPLRASRLTLTVANPLRASPLISSQASSLERMYDEQRARADAMQVQLQSACARVTELEEQCLTLQVRLRFSTPPLRISNVVEKYVRR